MIRYVAYLEGDADGPCMAHVPSLPGCAIRLQGLHSARELIRDAVAGYHAWLQRHGEPVPATTGPITIEITTQCPGIGPFDPGDAAALFPPDREPVTRTEMETYFRLMDHSRTDLLALLFPPATGSGPGLPDEILDWQADPDTWSIRRVLRHLAGAERWYVSRLVPPETLPAEWENLSDLGTFGLLDMVRRTAVVRLRQLSERQRADVIYPSRWTSHPDEPWTARKTLRRFLEHEREHTGQVAQNLASWHEAAETSSVDP